MDPKSDDSGSDTLDQSLQKKCVVADDDSSSSSSTSKKQPDAAVSERNAANAPTTEPGGINMSEPKDSPASPSPPPPPTTPTPQQFQSVPPSQQNSTAGTLAAQSSSSTSKSPPRAIITENNIQKVVVVASANSKDDNKDLAETTNTNTTTSSNSNSNSSSANNKEDSRGFESKVRQISDDLKDTTLADENSLEKLDGQQQAPGAASGTTKGEEGKDAPPADGTSPAAGSSSSTAAANCLIDIKNDSDGYDSDRTITYESPSKKSSTSSSSDKKKLKKITKKVRFKYNQHGKVCPDEGDDEDDDEDDGDDDDDDDDDEDTLNEGGRSKSLLDPSQFPLSFESPHDEDEDNLNDDASAQQLAGEAEVVEDPPPENGIQCILGKVSQMGKIEYLFRWANKPGLGVQWESEEVLIEICPNLIKLYEEQRAREREQDMHFAVRRKKTRQGLRNV